MLVSDFKVKSRLNNIILKGIFSGIHEIPLMRMRRKKDTLPYSHALLKYEFYGSGGDLIETNN